jgi:hypothetical protein
MKKASTLISVIIAIVVLLAALGIGFSVKQFRVRHAEKTAEAEAAPKPKEFVGRNALPGRGERSRPSGLTVEERAERQDERARENERVANMSEDERREYMRRQSERFGAGDRRSEQAGGRRPGGTGMSDEERQAMRERYENMSEEERAQAREQMRQKFGSRRRDDSGGMPGGGQDSAIRRGDGEGMTGEDPNRPPEN